MKIKKILAFVLSSFLVLGACACANDGENENKTNSNIVLINGFENVAEMDTLTNYGVLGKVSLNKDSAFVKSGKASAKVTVTADPYKTAAPYLLQAFNLQKREENHTDFSNAAFVTMQVYNPQSETMRIGVQLAYQQTSSMQEYYELAPNAWTQIKYNVTREYIPKVASLNNIPYVSGVRLNFERPDEDTTFYVDDLYLYKTTTPYVDVVMRLNKNEICSFDAGWQVAMTTLEKGSLDILMPSVALETELTSTGSGCSMKIMAPAGLADYTVTERWPGISLNVEMLKLVNWASYPATAKLCFDVYAPVVNGVDEVWLSAYSDGARYFSGPAEKVAPGRWTTISYTVAEMNATWEYTEERNFATTSYLSLRWGEHPGNDRILYLDNFRMEMA